MAKDVYSLAIVGSGIAGLTASIYASRYQLEHILIGEIPGGVMSESVIVENFPGFKSISGMDLSKRIKGQVLHYKPDWEYSFAESVEKVGKNFLIKTKNKKEFKAEYLVLATGTKRRQLGVKGEQELTGKGVHSCVTCDGYFYKDKTVVIVGGGDAGVTAALSISDTAKKVYVLNNLAYLTAMPYWQKKLKAKKNVELILDNGVVEFVGKDRLEKIILKNSYQGKKELVIDGVFVEIGSVPNTDLAQSLNVELDDRGYIKVDEAKATSANKVYAVGDVADGSNYFQQMLTAAAEGAIAVNAIYREVK